MKNSEEITLIINNVNFYTTSTKSVRTEFNPLYKDQTLFSVKLNLSLALFSQPLSLSLYIYIYIYTRTIQLYQHIFINYKTRILHKNKRQEYYTKHNLGSYKISHHQQPNIKKMLTLPPWKTYDNHPPITIYIPNLQIRDNLKMSRRKQTYRIPIQPKHLTKT